MVITYFGIIIYHLVEWIGIITKSSEAITDCKNMMAFSYLANLSRHEVPSMPASKGKYILIQNAMYYQNCLLADKKSIAMLL